MALTAPTADESSLTPCLNSQMPMVLHMTNDSAQPATMDENLPQRHPPHLLTLPLEIRHAIWDAMVNEINQKRDRRWTKRPNIEFASLMLSCSQLRDELRNYRPQNLVPWRGFENFMHYFTLDTSQEYHVVNPHMVLRRYRSITIEFRLSSTPQEYRDLAYVLGSCSPALEELRLIFGGEDKCGDEVFIHGCAYVENYEEHRLRKQGQFFKEARELQRKIIHMHSLRILVISNMNMQIFAGILRHKPRLQFAHLNADPRSVVHTNFTRRQVAELMLPLKDRFPPLKVLHISANMMLNAFSLPSYCAQTLEHLTWTTPDVWLGSNDLNRPIFRDTLQLIRNLVMNAHRLRTLRVCIQGPGRLDDDQQHLAIQAALVQEIPRIRSLHNFEVHVAKLSPYLGHDMMFTLSNNLKRFYTSDQLVSPRALHEIITERYLSADDGPSVAIEMDREEKRLQKWEPKPPLALPAKNLWPEYDATATPIKMWINPTSYIPIQFNESGSVLGAEVKRMCSAKEDRALFLPGIIGEDFRRKDYIPLGSGNLKFVAYEFRNGDFVCRTGGTGETVTQMVLRLNGRLLDRDRNRHLSTQNGYETIMPTLGGVSTSSETWNTSADRGVSLLLHSIHEIESSEPRNISAAHAELMNSPFTDDDRYFGREDEAMKIFQKERVARPWLLPLRTEPFLIHCGDPDDQCHWMCPGASVPTLSQIDQANATARASRIRREQGNVSINAVSAT